LDLELVIPIAAVALCNGASIALGIAAAKRSRGLSPALLAPVFGTALAAFACGGVSGSHFALAPAFAFVAAAAASTVPIAVLGAALAVRPPRPQGPLIAFSVALSIILAIAFPLIALSAVCAFTGNCL